MISNKLLGTFLVLLALVFTGCSLATDDAAGFDTLYEMGKVQWNTQKSAKGAQEALDYAQAQGSDEELGKAHYLLGYIFYQQSAYKESTFHFLKALDIYSRLGAVADMNRTRNSLAWLYIRGEEFDKAGQLLNEVLASNDSEATSSVHMRTYLRLGQCYLGKGSYEKAIQYYKQAEQLAKGSAELAVVLNKLGVVCEKSGDFEGKLHFHQRALALPGLSSKQQAVTTAYVGNAYLYLENWAEAERYCREARGLFEGLFMADDMVKAQNNISKALLKQGHLAEAEALLAATLESYPGNDNIGYTKLLRGQLSAYRLNDALAISLGDDEALTWESPATKRARQAIHEAELAIKEGEARYNQEQLEASLERELQHQRMLQLYQWLIVLGLIVGLALFGQRQWRNHRRMKEGVYQALEKADPQYTRPE